ncbi:MAG: SCO family protein [Bacteroidota bacterium]
MKSIKNLFIPLSLSFLFFFSACKDNRKLPYYGQSETKEIKNADGSITVDTIYKTIPDFSFLNQDSTYITNDTFKDKIYIADFFFTSCTSICPTMHRNMKSIFEEYKDNQDIMFLSHTIDFKYDKPSKLKKYAKKLDVYGDNWQFAYGNKDSIYNIARDYLVVVMEDSTQKEKYVHQGWLVLIDKNKHIRGAYDGTNDTAVAQLKKDIPVLLAEQKK